MRTAATALIGTICITIGVSATLTAAEPQISGTPDELTQFLVPEPLTVSIDGYAEKITYSDLAHVTLAAVTKQKTLSEALTANAAIRQNLVQTLIDEAITEDRINNSQFSTSPQYGWFGKKPSQFEVANRVKVTAATEQELTRIARLADQHEEVTVADIEFEHSTKEETQTEVRVLALANAKARAAVYADAVGLVLTPIAFDLGERRPLPRQGAIEEVIVTKSRIGTSDAGESDEALPVSFEEIRYASTATIRYRIGPR